MLVCKYNNVFSYKITIPAIKHIEDQRTCLLNMSKNGALYQVGGVKIFIMFHYRVNLQNYL